MASNIQSILFDNNKWKVSDAHKWLRQHKFRPIKKVHITKNKLRFRLRNPTDFDRFRIRKISDGIEFIIGFY